MRLTCNKSVVVIILYIIFLSSNNTYAIVTVGLLEDGCDFSTLQAAYNSNDPIVHVTTQMSHSQTFTISKSKIFIGGYDDCDTARNGQPGNDRTIWFKSAALPSTVIKINANEAFQSVITFSNFDITGGKDLSLGGAGGIRIQGNSAVTIFNSVIHENLGDYGGGISIYGENAKLTLNATEILENVATTAGGGISCLLSATVIIQNESLLGANASGNMGGGLYTSSECTVSILSADIYANQAIMFGGGIYADDGSVISMMGSSTDTVVIATNKTTTENNTPTGGGIYAKGVGTSITAINTTIYLNFAERWGAGLVIKDFANFTMGRIDEPCTYTANYACSSIYNNQVIAVEGISVSAAGDFDSNATIDISQTLIVGNSSQDTAVFSISNNANVRLEGNLILANRSLNANGNNKLIDLSGPQGSGGVLDFHYNTVIGNIGDHLFKLNNTSQQTLNISHSIISAQSDILYMPAGMAHNIHMDCTIVNEEASLNSLGDLATVIVTDPSFVNAEGSNYHLSPNSPAIDYCDESLEQSQHNDLEGNQRGIDDPNVIDNLGVFDLGAFEYQAIDIIFNNGFE